MLMNRRTMNNDRMSHRASKRRRNASSAERVANVVFQNVHIRSLIGSYLEGVESIVFDAKVSPHSPQRSELWLRSKNDADGLYASPFARLLSGSEARVTQSAAISYSTPVLLKPVDIKALNPSVLRLAAVCKDEPKSRIVVRDLNSAICFENLRSLSIVYLDFAPSAIKLPRLKSLRLVALFTFDAKIVCPQLESLELSYMPKFTESVEALTALTELKMYDAKSFDGDLNNLSNLERLELSSLPCFVAHACSWPKLKHLAVCEVDGFHGPIDDCADLTTLHLTCLPNVATSLPKLSALEEIVLEKVPLLDLNFHGLSRLKRASVAATERRPLCGFECPQLEDVRLAGLGPPWAFRGCRSAKSVYFRDCAFAGDVLDLEMCSHVEFDRCNGRVVADAPAVESFAAHSSDVVLRTKQRKDASIDNGLSAHVEYV